MKTITINSEKYGIHNVLIDDQDYKWASSMKWFIYKSKHQKQYYAVCHLLGKTVRMHRMIMKVSDHKILIDHIDGNGLNNTRINLRSSTQSTNLMNRGPNSSNKYGFKGVSYSKKDKKYTCFIRLNYKTFFGGNFNTPEEAAKKYNEMAIKFHGEFAYQNPV